MNSFIRTSSGNKDFQYLVSLLDKELAVRDGDEHAFYSQFNKIATIRNVVICYIDKKAVGAGGSMAHFCAMIIFEKIKNAIKNNRNDF